MRGFWYMAESIIASIILISFLIVLSHQSMSITYIEDMSIRGHKILQDASQVESFRFRVYSEDFTGLLNSIEVPGYYYNISICDYSDLCNGYEPSNNNSTVWASYYIFAGNEKYEPKVLRLYIWR